MRPLVEVRNDPSDGLPLLVHRLADHLGINLHRPQALARQLVELPLQLLAPPATRSWRRCIITTWNTEKVFDRPAAMVSSSPAKRRRNPLHAQA
jgi:hypothetical protein